jgi:dTDP-4-dehydrorhamnose 3,5-epimerase-like enzyme
MEKPNYTVPTVSAVQTIKSKGPWGTKSGGNLNVLFGFDINTLNEKYFKYEKSEIERIPQEIRGLRSYSVSELEKDRVGANEWHRIRNELVFMTEGSAEWICEDLYGNKKNYKLDTNHGIWTPPFIMHTYKTTSEKNGILVIANTLFDPNNPKTHDSYSFEEFHKLQSQYKV